jgi:hypothetical protein
MSQSVCGREAVVVLQDHENSRAGTAKVMAAAYQNTGFRASDIGTLGRLRSFDIRVAFDYSNSINRDPGVTARAHHWAITKRP